MNDTAYDMTYDTTYDTTLRHNTITSITLEQGTTKRTVQRWIAKCGEIGELRENTRYFSDEEKAQIVSHKSDRKPADEPVIEAELIEPGAIQLHRTESHTAAPLMAFNLEPIQIDLPSLDVAALAAQTAQFEQAAEQGANAIAAYFGARLDMGLASIAAKQDNLLRGIEAQALNGAARAISNQQAKPGKH
jgi:hypothetical protein